MCNESPFEYFEEPDGTFGYRAKVGLVVLTEEEAKRLKDHIAGLESLVRDMYDAWSVCHCHPGSYQTIEASKLMWVAEQLRLLGIEAG